MLNEGFHVEIFLPSRENMFLGQNVANRTGQSVVNAYAGLKHMLVEDPDKLCQVQRKQLDVTRITNRRPQRRMQTKPKIVIRVQPQNGRQLALAPVNNAGKTCKDLSSLCGEPRKSQRRRTLINHHSLGRSMRGGALGAEAQCSSRRKILALDLKHNTVRWKENFSSRCGKLENHRGIKFFKQIPTAEIFFN
jgi:hypothetical protein